MDTRQSPMVTDEAEILRQRLRMTGLGRRQAGEFTRDGGRAVPMSHGAAGTNKANSPGRSGPGNPKSEARYPKQVRNPNVRDEPARLGGGCAEQSQFASRVRGHRGRTPYGPGSSPGQAPPAKAGVTTNTTNKANPGRGGLGIDHGLWIIDDLGPETPRPECPKQASPAGAEDAMAPNKANPRRISYKCL